MLGASFTVAAVAQILRSKKGITAVGNAQVSTAQSKFGGASALFDGTGDGLVIPSNSDFAFGTGNFTIEYWMRPTTLVSFDTSFDARSGAEAAPVIYTESTTLKYGVGNTEQIAGGTLSTGVWHHIAVCRSGTSTKLFLNGTQVGSTYTDTNTYVNIAPVHIGSLREAGGSFDGYIDEVRVSNSARYTANFTAPTTPFQNDANTVLLIHADGTNNSTFFEDDNGVRASRGVTAVGNAQVDTAQSQFGGASALFDGTGDYLTVENIAGGITADQTFEFWIRFANLPSSGGFRMVAGDGGGERYMGLLNDGGTYRWEVSFSSGQYVERFTATVSTNTWYHVALTKSGSTLKVYQGGTQLTSAVSFNTMSSEKTLFVSGTNYIGSWNTSSNFLNGWMDEIRVSNSVRYTANFTAPTQPFVNDNNTVLLIHADGTDATTVFRDDNGALGSNWTGRTQRTVTAFGNAQVDTAQSQFGGTSALFDGNNDYITVASVPGLGTGDFTAEMWIRLNAINDLQVFWDNRTEDDSTPNGWIWYIDGNNKMVWYDGNNYVGTTSFAAGQWYHIAASRTGTTLRFFINGVLEMTQTNSANHNGSTPTTNYIGMSFQVVTANSYNGWIDEVRLSNSARYTAAFTPSSTAFVNDANTLFLLHFEGADASTAFTDDIGTGRNQKSALAIGTAKISTAQSKFGGSSSIYDGSANGIISRKIATFGTGDFTIEGWVRSASLASENYYIFDCRNTIDGTQAPGANLAVIYSGTTSISFFTGGNVLQGSNSYTANTWQHFALVRSSGVAQFYFNGVGSSNSHALTTNFAECDITFGSYAGATGGGDFIGYIDEMRVSNIARYTANFTAPTAQFQNDVNTLLLLHCDGANNSTVIFDDNGIAPYTP
jgi:hypothetical protein